MNNEGRGNTTVKTPEIFIAFDLDSTLGDFTRMELFLDLLFLNAAFDANGIPFPSEIVTPELESQIHATYTLFLAKLIDLELSGKTGIMNPKFMDLFKNDFYPNMMANPPYYSKAVIYSNNSDAIKLEFAKDVLESYVGGHAFCNLLHWGHPLRTKDKTRLPGDASKTWVTLKRAFTDAECGYNKDSIVPDRVFFFDDQDHPDLIEVLGPNYKHEDMYFAKTPFSYLCDAFVDAATESGLITNEQWYTLLSKLFSRPVDERLIRKYFHVISSKFTGGSRIKKRRGSTKKLRHGKRVTFKRRAHLSKEKIHAQLQDQKNRKLTMSRK